LDQPLEPSSSSSGRDFVDRPKSLDELRQRPKFVAPFKVTPDVKLVDVLTDYSFERKEPCGLSSCSQWHYDGYLVVTSSGAETNIGNTCGKNAFGIEFKSARARFKRDEDRRVTLGRAMELQSEAPRVKEKISELANRTHGVRWLYSLREAVRSNLGRQGYDHVKYRAARNDYAVIRVKEVPNKDASTSPRGARKQPFKYVNEHLGTLAPLDWVIWDFPEQLFKAVKDEFGLFAELSPSDMELRELKKRLKRFDGWEQRIKDAESVLSQALRFLTPENLKVVDLALSELRKGNSGPQSKSLVEWSESDEYKRLLMGAFKEGQTLAE
jgi:hypothetical protein